MAWPTAPAVWQHHLEEAKREFAATANAIADFEPVTMVAASGYAIDARARCTSAVEVIEAPIDDIWLRDSGPIIVVDDHGNRRGIDFVFNSWGERFLPYDNDAAIAEVLLDRLAIERFTSPMVLEGGSITVDGEGTLITTEQCLLNPNRNPLMSRQQIEDELRRTLGVTTIIWLKWGHHEDRITDGHVDGVCTYVRPGVVLAQTCPDPSNPNHDLMAENLDVLLSARDAGGRRFEIVEMPHFAYFDLDGARKMTSYPNFYIANGAVIVPTSDQTFDRDALDIIRLAFPEREVVSVTSRIVAFGGGGTHCITQQVPSGIATGRVSRSLKSEERHP